MAALFLCNEGTQRRFPYLLLILARRKCALTENRASSTQAKTTHGPESICIYPSYKNMLILSALLPQKYLTFINVYSMQNIRYHKPIKKPYWAYGSLLSAESTSRFSSLQTGLINSGLQIWPQILGKHKGRNAVHNCFYCSVRHASDLVKERIAKENRKTRERFEACEKEWEKLVDERLLQPEDFTIHEAHKLAVARGHFTYDDPYTGCRVMTRLRHFLRGSCCGSACRHCVYDHVNVAEKEKSQRVFNSSFWVDVSTRPDLAVVSPKPYHVGGWEPSQRKDKREIIESEVSDPLLYKH
ncbi:hypothetical protein O3P69_011589 [Scylla paramamosain]|uniref:Uncharacterized protein n=1 Tax=Scylla paramamosain TaxID=85552 RepID=A0AAW0T6D3_SCYPA